MEPHAENRRYPRHEIPVVIEAPSISAFSLVPENASAGGFGLVLPSAPDLEMGCECTIRVADKVFKECWARVVWLQVLETAPPSWHVGFSLALPDENKREDLEATLREVWSRFV